MTDQADQKGLTEVKLWRCPECGDTHLRNMRHLHSLDQPPWSQKVEREEVTAYLPQPGYRIVALPREDTPNG